MGSGCFVNFSTGGNEHGENNKSGPAVTLEAVTVPLADGRRGVVLILTDEYSRKTIVRAMPASR